MRRFLPALIFFVTSLSLCGTAAAAGSHPTHYYYFDERVDLRLQENRLFVQMNGDAPAAKFSGDVPFVEFAGATLKETGHERWRFIDFDRAVSGADETGDRVDAIARSAQVDFVSPVFHGVHFGWMAVTPDILVRFKEGYRDRADRIALSVAPGLDLAESRFGGMEGAVKLHSNARDGFEVLEIANRLAEDPRVLWAEPDFMMTGRHDLTPNDPGFSDLWGIKNTGQFGGTPDMDMDGDTAWDTTIGDTSIVVLILDTGAQQDHPDLNQIPGQDFTSENFGGGPGNLCDNHGTAVSGCVSGVINNSLGTVGISPGSRTASARIGISTVPCDGTWSGQMSWTVDALHWAMTSGMRVSNNSNSYGGDPSSVTDKYAETREAGMVHFASAGNDNQEALGYPSNLPTVMSIMALTPTGARASFSSWGSGLAFGAPGTSVYTTDRTGSAGYNSDDYAFVQGTSFSSPYSAGVAALLLSKDPGLPSWAAEDILKYTSVDLGAGGFDNIFGWGFVNAENALNFGGWFDASAAPLDDGGTGAGAAWGDFDGDGDLDLYVVNDGANTMLRQGSSSFSDVTAAPLDDEGDGAGAVWGDYDNDGDLDLYLANNGANKLFRNSGNGSFTDVTTGPLGDAGDGRTVAWVDVENDGDLDLYVVNNGANKLFRNDAGVFVDATASPLGDTGDGRGLAWGDFDDDGDQDLYIANNGSNKLLRNDGSGTFTDVTTGPLGDVGNGYGAMWGDYDNDLDLDLYLSNDGGNNLLRNDGGGTFTDVTTGVLGDAGSGRGTAWADSDNDGDLDLYVVNYGGANVLFRNDGGVFADVTSDSLGSAGNGAAATWVDHDENGLIDLYVVNEGANKLFQNLSAPNNHWVTLDLVGVVSNLSAVGARARVVAGGASQVREVTAGCGYLSMEPLALEFGLGSAVTVDTVEILWPSGLVKTLTGLAADSIYTILELAPPVVAVTSPDGGEEWGQGSLQAITWTNAGGETDDYLIEYSTDNGAGWDSVHYEAGPGTGSYDWTVPMTPTEQALVRITMQNGDGMSIDTSDAVFAIKAVPVVAVTSPNGGEQWEVGALENITWSNTGDAATAHTVEQSADAGATWSVLVDSVAGDGGGSFAWTVADTPTREALVRVTLFNANGSASDEGDSLFVISPPVDLSNELVDATVSPLDDTGEGRGIAWADFDGDNDLDLYVVNGDGANRLFENQPGGFVDVAAGQLADVGAGFGAAWGDYDNDGDVDLYLSNDETGNRLFRNDGGTFVNEGAAPIDDNGRGRTAAWADYDNDGDVDLYLVNLSGGNMLFANNGDGTFTDDTSAPLDGGGVMWGASWADYDNDGDPDLYVTRLGTNMLFRNDGNGNFTDVTAGPEGDGGFGFGCAWGDYDNDGDLDLYITNNGANVLLRNDAGSFVDVTSGPLGDVANGYAAAWGDQDNDGDLDLYLVNDGFNRLFRNDGGGVFIDGASEDLLDTGSGQCAAWGDMDSDGDIDLYLTNIGTNRLFRNDLSSGAHWIHVNLVGVASNKAGIGARVRVVAGGVSQIREISGGSGYLGQNSLTAEFGLGAATQVDTLEITWPSEAVQTVTTLAADQFMTIVEPQARWVDVTNGPLGDAGAGQGVAWGDMDGDGDDDLYLTNSGAANVLMRNEGNDVFTDATAAPLGDMSSGAGTGWADQDNDGDLDLYLVNAGGANKMFRNEGGGLFADATSGPLGDAGFGFSMAWGEFGGDGNVDLYMVNAGGSNRLFRNDGGGVFVDETAGPLGDAIGFGFSTAWGDYDNDGDSDLYVGNGFGANKLLRNDGSGVFTDVTAGPLGDANSTYGVAWGDYDNDGDLDLYLANELAANKLLRNDGGTFVDATAGPLGDTNSSYSTAWVDFDNDGDLDLFVAQSTANRLFENQGGSFTDAAEAVLRDALSAAGSAWADYDGDGDLDLYLVNSTGANGLFRNDDPAVNHWVHASLVGSASNRSGIGARVRVVAGGQAQIREVSGGSGYLSQNSLAVEFGLGSNTIVDSIQVRWPSGAVTDTTNVAADQAIVLFESQVQTGVTGGLPLPASFALLGNAPNPFNPVTVVRFALPEPSRVRLTIFDISGRQVKMLHDRSESAGWFSATWNGTDDRGRTVGSGIYFVRMEAASFADVKKMVLIK